MKPAPTPTLTWSEHVVDSIGVAIPVIDPAAVSSWGSKESGGALQELAGVKVGIWWNADVEQLRKHYQPPRKATFGQVESVEICGLAAKRLEASVEAAESAVAAKVTPDGIGHSETDFPALHAVAIGFEHKGTQVLIVWQVDAEKRDALRGDQAHFFANLRCL